MLTSSRNRRIISDRAPRRPPRAPARVTTALLLLAGLGVLPFRALAASAEVAESLASRLPQAVAEAQRLVEKVRGVPFRGTVPSAVLPERDLARILEKKLAEDLPTSFERYASSLSAVGLIDPDPDLQKKLTRLYVRQVAGFYDPSERKFYVVPERSTTPAASVPGLGVESKSLVEEALLTHELTHALQDRRLDLDKRMKALKESTDSLLALQAFLEGEATVVMAEALVERLPAETRGLLGSDALTQLTSSLSAVGTGGIEGADGVPEYFVKELLFPYVTGAAYLQYLRSRNGWAAVDEVYEHLPTTTAEVLHPGKSAAGRLRLSASDRPDSKDLPPGATPLYTDILGEFVIRSLLERAGSDEAAVLAAERQDDRVVFFEQGKVEGRQVGFVWRIRCSTAPYARALGGQLVGLYSTRPQPARPTVRVSGDVVEVSRFRRMPGEPSSPAAAR